MNPIILANFETLKNSKQLEFLDCGEKLNKFFTVEQNIKGLDPQTVNIIVGASGSGKSFFSLSLSLELGNYINVLHVSCENKAELDARRINKYYDANQSPQYFTYITANLLIEQTPDLDLADDWKHLIYAIEAAIKEHPCEVIVIDGLEAKIPVDDNIAENGRWVMSRFREMAKTYNVVIFFTCQMGREAEAYINEEAEIKYWNLNVFQMKGSASYYTEADNTVYCYTLKRLENNKEIDTHIARITGKHRSGYAPNMLIVDGLNLMNRACISIKKENKRLTNKKVVEAVGKMYIEQCAKDGSLENVAESLKSSEYAGLLGEKP